MRDEAEDSHPVIKNNLERQATDPLHGVTLQAMLTQLVAAYGWETLGRRVDIRCFTHEPSIASSLKFLRRTPWARDKVEALYLQWKTGSFK